MRMLFYALPVLVCASDSCGADVRGAWVTAWSSGYLTREQADATITAAKKAGLNTLFIQVRKQGDAYYKSTIEPRAPELAPDYDPLAYVICRAHAVGMKVHAWVNVFRVWKTPDSPPTNPNHVVNEHPEWLTKTADGSLIAGEGYYLDPGVPAVREHNAAVIAEIVQNYDLNGIHLDYIRYPGRDFGYSDAALKRYYAETGSTVRPDPGDARWCDWRRAQVREQVRLIRKRLREIKPGLAVTAATIAWGDCAADFESSAAYAKVYQDWKRWLAHGLLDANVPMNYKAEAVASGAKSFRGWLSGLRKWSAGKPVWVGINVVMNDPARVLRQIEAVGKAGHQGFVLFSFNETPKRDALVSALKPVK